jgi:tetratricopeptide (TPR) repeat protein
MGRRYKAFISYSWADKTWAEWAHRALETYHTPRQLIGADGAFGPVADRLHPIFKDREEEAAGHGITAAIEAALAASDFLVVVCSPRSAQSRWVNREIAWFKRNRDKSRILTIVVDGEPLASLKGDEAHECFPKSLLYEIDASLEPTGVLEDPPLAADARRDGDGKRVAKLKIAAAMLGLGLDLLIRRDDRRRTLRRRILTGSALALSGSMSLLAYISVIARNEAQRERAEAVAARSDAEDLVEFMLTDLHSNLAKVGRLDILKSPADKALEYYRRQDVGKLDPDALARRARALHEVGEVDQLSGDADAASRAFREAANTTQELLRRDPTNWQRVFDHAQSVFWLAYDETERGDNDAAMAQFLAYRDLAGRLVAIAPEKPESQIELAYAESNVGTSLVKQNRLDEAIERFIGAQAALESVAPRTRDIALNLAQAYSHAASAYYKKGDFQASIMEREKQLAVLDVDPLGAARDNEVSEARATALQFLFEAYFVNGDFEKAEAANEKDRVIWDELRKTDQKNQYWLEQGAQAILATGLISVRERDWKRSAQEIATAMSLLLEGAAVDPDNARINRAIALAVGYASLLKENRIDETLVNEARDRFLRHLSKKIENEAHDAKDAYIYGCALIAVGDGVYPRDQAAAESYWRRASDLILDSRSAEFWAMIHGLRTDLRLGSSRFSGAGGEAGIDLMTSLGGIFADEITLYQQNVSTGESDVYASDHHH